MSFLIVAGELPLNKPQLVVTFTHGLLQLMESEQYSGAGFITNGMLTCNDHLVG